MSDDALVLIAAAHLLPGCDATVVDLDAEGVTVKTDTGEHRVPARVAESLYVLAR
jgi:sugar/nucleoside kinase (ribokinase family)